MAGPDKRSYSAGHFLLSIDNQPAVLKKLSGLNVKAEVATVNMGPEQLAMKHISVLKYEPCTLEVGMSMGKSLYEWIKASLDKAHIRKNGYVMACDYNYKAMGYRHFSNALITEITIPAMDGSSKDGAFFTVKFQPEKIEYADGDGQDAKGVVNVGQKKWLCSNFRLRLGDLDCTKVSKIDAITIKQGVVNDAVGEQREDTFEASKLEIPNVKITLAASHAKTWIDWHKTFVVQGKCGQEDELNGAIEWLSPSGEVLGTLNLMQVGIFSLNTEDVEANKDSIARIVVECYVEGMTIDLANAQ
jgi:phage tail-like protein